jgi:hypothetical protein
VLELDMSWKLKLAMCLLFWPASPWLLLTLVTSRRARVALIWCCGVMHAGAVAYLLFVLLQLGPAPAETGLARLGWGLALAGALTISWVAAATPLLAVCAVLLHQRLRRPAPTPDGAGGRGSLPRRAG